MLKIMRGVVEQGEAQGKGATSIGITGGLDASSMFLDDTLGDGQAKTAACKHVRTSLLCTIEALKDMGEIGACDAHARVFDLDDCLGCVGGQL